MPKKLTPEEIANRARQKQLDDLQKLADLEIERINKVAAEEAKKRDKKLQEEIKAAKKKSEAEYKEVESSVRDELKSRKKARDDLAKVKKDADEEDYKRVEADVRRELKSRVDARRQLSAEVERQIKREATLAERENRRVSVADAARAKKQSNLEFRDTIRDVHRVMKERAVARKQEAVENKKRYDAFSPSMSSDRLLREASLPHFANPLSDLQYSQPFSDTEFRMPKSKNNGGHFHTMNPFAKNKAAVVPKEFRQEEPEKPSRGIDTAAMLATAGETAAAAAALATAAALGAMAGGLELVKKAFFTTWDYIDTKVLPTTSMLNKALGAGTDGMQGLRKEAMHTGLQFEALGLGFAHGAQSVKEFGLGLRSASIEKTGLNTLLKVSEYADVGAQQTGELARSFQAAGLGINKVESSMIDATAAAKEYNVPVNMVRKEFGQNTDALARFGAENSLQFSRAIAQAEHYGLSIKDMEASFGEAMDNFETSSDIAAKINTAFGTNLDSVKLMNASDEERMSMVQDAIKQTGFVWSSQTRVYNDLLKSTLGLKDNDAGLRMFGTEATSGQAKKRIDEQKALDDGTKEWNKALSSLGTQLVSIEQLTRNFFMAIGNVVSRLLGFKDGIDGTKTGVKAFSGFVKTLTDKINEFAFSIESDGKGTGVHKFFDTVLGMVQNLNSSLMDTGDLIDTIRHGGLNGSSSDMGKNFAAALENNDTMALDKLNTQFHINNPLSPFQQQDAYASAARRAHISPEEVENKLQMAAKKRPELLASQYSMMQTGVPSDYVSQAKQPMVINLHVGAEHVAKAIVPAVNAATARVSMGAP